VDVSEPASISSGIAKRYATAIFELAKESKSLDKLESNLDDLSAALDGSADRNGMGANSAWRATQRLRNLTGC